MSRDDVRAPLTRCLTVWLAVTGAAGALWLAAAPELASARSAWSAGTLASQRFDTLLVWLAALVAAGCLLWLWVVTTVVTAGAARGRGATRVVGCPAGLRRALLAACGVALASTLAAPAHAVPTHAHGPGQSQDQSLGQAQGQSPVAGQARADGGGGSALEGLPLPERPAEPWGAPERLPPPPTERLDAPAARPRPDQAAPSAGVVVVRPGDTLWDIAAAGLSDDAAPAAVDERWREIYDANADRVGSDPDLILPTTHLRLPRRNR